MTWETATRWWGRARPFVFAAVVFVVGLIPVNDERTPDWLALPTVWRAAIPAALALAAAWLLPRRWPMVVLAVVVSPFDTLIAGTCLIVASYVIATGYRGLAELVLSLVAVLCAPLIPTLASAPSVDDLMGWLGGTALFVWLPLTVGLWVRTRRVTLDSLRDKTSQLEREQAAVAARARAEERGRIAHEMHDVVAHRVSLMVMHAGALEVNAPDAAVAESAELIRATGSEALAQLRDVLGVLRYGETARTTPQPTLADLDALLAESRRAGVDATATFTGKAQPLSTLVDQTAYRVIRESLTNVHKHAGAVACVVTLDHQPERLLVTVRNDPPRRPPKLPGSGTGLIGLRERLTLLGGELSTRTEPDGGFRLTASIPLRTETAAA